MDYRTVLLTGVTGFIAKRIARELLLAGHFVVGSVRSAAREREVRAALSANGVGAADLERLRFAPLDLTRDAGWDEALSGVDALIHTASPFPLGDAGGEAAIVGPAVDGTNRALAAAQRAGVTRVVLTSSMEAIMHNHATRLSEADWSDLDAASCTAYSRSKILAERAAWDFAAAHPEMQLTVINPGVVCGTPMDAHYGSSIEVVKRVYSGRDPMMPDISFPLVALEDVARAHVAALSHPESIGHRYVLAEAFLSMRDMALSLKADFPDRRIATRLAPHFLIGLLALFDPPLRAVRHMQGRHPVLDNSAARRDLGIDFIPAREALRRSAAFLAAEEAGKAA